MSKQEQMDVLIAIYLFEDLGRKDYDAVMDLVEEKEVEVQGVVLASKDDQGEMQVIEAGDHAVRKGATMLGGAGLVVGLFAPPLLAATAVGAGVGAVAGKFAKHRVGERDRGQAGRRAARRLGCADRDLRLGRRRQGEGGDPERHPELGGADRLEERQGAQGGPRRGFRRPERLAERRSASKNGEAVAISIGHRSSA